MNASDRATGIVLRDLRNKTASIARIAADMAPARCNAWQHPSKTEYMRHLDDLPFPSEHPISLKTGKPGHGGGAKFYGQWLYNNNKDAFNQQFEIWRKTQ